MTRKIKAILHGVGTVVDIFPARRIDARLERSTEDRIHDAWARVGSHLGRAMGDYEQKQQKACK